MLRLEPKEALDRRHCSREDRERLLDFLWGKARRRRGL